MVNLWRGCLVCSNMEMQEIWHLPGLPLTGIYSHSPEAPDYDYVHDQTLTFCERCGHAQLSQQVDPDLLYKRTYTHRTSDSPIATSGNRFLLDFIRQNAGMRAFRQLVEIGCNDLVLLESVTDLARNRAGIDPIWPIGVTEADSGIRLSGGFAETADYGELVSEPIDLVVSAHTLEHVQYPTAVVERMVPFLSSECMLIVEVPSAERMTQQSRMDQVFSQHVQYYSVSSLCTLFRPHGFALTAMTYNYAYWGGTQLLCFERGQSRPALPTPLKIDAYLDAIKGFEGAIANSRHQIRSADGPLVGYGAAQMLPILAYHIGDAFERLSCILDDDPRRHGLYFPLIDSEIVSAKLYPRWPETTVVVTALDSSRPLLHSALAYQPRTIVLPVGIA